MRVASFRLKTEFDDQWRVQRPHPPSTLKSSAPASSAHDETRKFVAEQHQLITEQAKRIAEQAKLGRDRALAPWQVALSGMAADAAFFGAGAAFIKLIGP